MSDNNQLVLYQPRNASNFVIPTSINTQNSYTDSSSYIHTHFQNQDIDLIVYANPSRITPITYTIVIPSSPADLIQISHSDQSDQPDHTNQSRQPNHSVSPNTPQSPNHTQNSIIKLFKTTIFYFLSMFMPNKLLTTLTDNPLRFSQTTPDIPNLQNNPNHIPHIPPYTPTTVIKSEEDLNKTKSNPSQVTNLHISKYYVNPNIFINCTELFIELLDDFPYNFFIPVSVETLRLYVNQNNTNSLPCLPCLPCSPCLPCLELYPEHKLKFISTNINLSFPSGNPNIVSLSANTLIDTPNNLPNLTYLKLNKFRHVPYFKSLKQISSLNTLRYVPERYLYKINKLNFIAKKSVSLKDFDDLETLELEIVRNNLEIILPIKLDKLIIESKTSELLNNITIHYPSSLKELRDEVGCKISNHLNHYPCDITKMVVVRRHSMKLPMFLKELMLVTCVGMGIPEIPDGLERFYLHLKECGDCGCVEGEEEGRKSRQAGGIQETEEDIVSAANTVSTVSTANAANAVSTVSVANVANVFGVNGNGNGILGNMNISMKGVVGGMNDKDMKNAERNIGKDIRCPDPKSFVFDKKFPKSLVEMVVTTNVMLYAEMSIKNTLPRNFKKYPMKNFLASEV